MSLHENVLGEYKDSKNGFSISVKVWDWLRSEMDVSKFRRRAVYAHNNPNIPVKVVLAEYNGSYKSENSSTEFYISDSKVNTRYLQYRGGSVLDYLHYQLADRDPNVLVYTRRKIVDGVPHLYQRQVVVKFNANQRPDVAPSVIEHLDESECDENHA